MKVKTGFLPKLLGFDFMYFGAYKITFIALLRVTVVGIATYVFFWSQPALGQDVICLKGDALRRIHVVIENIERDLPCEVIFWSPPAEPRRLWRAEFERGFCAEKVRAIVAQLTDDQWLCGPSDSPDIELRQRRWQPTM